MTRRYGELVTAVGVAETHQGGPIDETMLKDELTYLRLALVAHQLDGVFGGVEGEHAGLAHRALGEFRWESARGWRGLGWCGAWGRFAGAGVFCSNRS